MPGIELSSILERMPIRRIHWLAFDHPFSHMKSKSQIGVCGSPKERPGADAGWRVLLLPGRDESDLPGGEDMDFDIRALATELKMPLSNDNHKEVLCAAIDSGLIKPRRVFQL